MASIRRNTYVLQRRPVSSHLEDASPMDRQNLMRLRVNRIALVQELRVEHIINHLIEKGVICSKDLRLIETGTTTQDRTRLFVDLLKEKKKEADWYRHFRDALLLPNADTNTQKKYRCLVEFLDNTIIHRPTTHGTLLRDFAPHPPPSSLQRFKPLPPIKPNSLDHHDSSPDTPNILRLHLGNSVDNSPRLDTGGNSGRETGEPGATAVLPGSGDITKGVINHWVPAQDDLQSQISEPEDLFKSLEDSELPEDHERLKEERHALKDARSLELACALYKRRKLPENKELCECGAVKQVLDKADQYHLLTKHLRGLWKTHGVDVLGAISDSYYHLSVLLQPNDSTQRIGDVIRLGFSVFDFLLELYHNDGAERTLIAILGFLNKHPRLETLMATFRGYVKLMQLKNREYDFHAVNNAHRRATEVTWQIEKVSFGQDLVEKGEMFLELSHMMLESGSINSAFTWGFKALQHVREDSREAVINVLCNAVMTYCTKWNVKRAELLAVQAVQLARQHFGTRHPMFLKALLTYCYYSNEFRQDQAGVEIAQLALCVAESVYGTPTPQTAHAHRALCKALAMAGNFHSDEYLQHAACAMDIARAYFPPTHPTMYLFHFTMAFALHWKALHVPFSEQTQVLGVALGQAEKARDIALQHFPDLSLRHAQILGLIGQIATKLNRLDVAESSLVKSEQIMRLCLPARNNYLLVSQASLAMFYSISGSPQTTATKALLQGIVQALDSPGVRLKWVSYVFDHLIALHQSENEGKQAQIVEAQKEEWLANNPPFSTQITPSVLMESHKPYAEFLADFNIWQKQVDKLKENKIDV